MPIEFRCANCQRLLRTGDDTAGKSARCPECGAVMPIPDPEPLAAEIISHAPHDAPAAAPWSAPMLDVRMYALRRVSGPASCLIVLGALTVAAGIMSLSGVANERVHVGDVELFTPATRIPSATLQIVLATIMILGGAKMKRLESHGLAMAASIVAMLPCVGPCCCFGLPLGIWAIVILSDEYVKAAFS